MRVIPFVLAFGLGAFQLAAQSRPAVPTGPTDRGSKLVGGSASVSHSDEGNGQTATSYQVTPYVLFFVMPRLALGGQAGINYATFESGTSIGGGHSFGWLLGPAMRWHFPTSSIKLLPFVGVNLALSSIRIRMTLSAPSIPRRSGGRMARSWRGWTTCSRLTWHSRA